MSCDACRESFDAAEAERERVGFIDARHPLCECQVLSVSIHSNGPVKDEETLVRILVSPIHIKGGKVKGAAFTRAETSGLSMVRNEQASDDDIRRVAEHLVAAARVANGEKAGVLGVLLIKASLIRETCAEGEHHPAYCVYDTALEDNLPHVEAFQRVHATPMDLVALRRATLLKRVEHTFVPAIDFRNGLLTYLAPAA